MLSRCGRNAAKRGRGAVASMGSGGGGGWARAASSTTSAVSIAKSGYESRVLPSVRATSALTWSRGFAAGATTTTTTTTTTKPKPKPSSAVKAVSEPSTSASSSSSTSSAQANAARQSSARGGVLVDVGFSRGFVDDDRRVPRALTVGALIAKLRRIELAMEREMERGLVAFDPGVGGFQMASVKRKRKKAMNKHKHRKRRRRDRHKA